MGHHACSEQRVQRDPPYRWLHFSGLLLLLLLLLILLILLFVLPGLPEPLRPLGLLSPLESAGAA